MICMGAVREPPLRTVHHCPQRFVTPAALSALDKLPALCYTRMNNFAAVKIFSKPILAIDELG
jgi:hypothetical protein